MSATTEAGAATLEEVCMRVAQRLRARQSEITEAIFARIRDPAFGPIGTEDPEYVRGLHDAVAAAVDLGLSRIEQGEEHQSSIPSPSIQQARRAALLGVSLDIVLRRYIAGQALLSEFIMEEVGSIGFLGDEIALQRHLRETQTPLLERLTASIVAQYDAVEHARKQPSEQHRLDLVRGLLAGKQPDASDALELDYDFGIWHVGLIAVGEHLNQLQRGIEASRTCRLLAVSENDRSLWAWVGHKSSALSIVDRLAGELPAGLVLVTGEPRKGLEGWRLTFGEAQAALPVALRNPPGMTRAADVMLEAAILRDPMLVGALVRTFLSPLEDLRYRGQTAFDTLRAFFEARRNVSSTAHRLGVARNTVESRLHEIEERLGRPLHACSAQLEVALRIQALGEENGFEASKARALTSEPSSNGSFSHSFEQSAESDIASLSTLPGHGLAVG